MHANMCGVHPHCCRLLSKHSVGDMLAQGRGRAATSVQWGAWGGGGMALRVAGFLERMARLGLGVVQPAAGLAALAQVLAGAWRPSPAQRALFVGARTPGRCSCSLPSAGLMGCTPLAYSFQSTFSVRCSLLQRKPCEW